MVFYCLLAEVTSSSEMVGKVQMRYHIGSLNGLNSMVGLLEDHNEDLKCLAAETLAVCMRCGTSLASYLLSFSPC